MFSKDTPVTRVALPGFTKLEGNQGPPLRRERHDRDVDRIASMASNASSSSFTSVSSMSSGQSNLHAGHQGDSGTPGGGPVPFANPKSPLTNGNHTTYPVRVFSPGAFDRNPLSVRTDLTEIETYDNFTVSHLNGDGGGQGANGEADSDIDLDDLTGSQQDLKLLHDKMVEERKKEEEMAALEQQRLEEILNMCAEYEKQMSAEQGAKEQRISVMSDSSVRSDGSSGSGGRNSMTKIKTNGSLTMLASPNSVHREEFWRRRSSNSSNSEDEFGIDNSTIKRRPNGTGMDRNGSLNNSFHGSNNRSPATSPKMAESRSRENSLGRIKHGGSSLQNSLERNNSAKQSNSLDRNSSSHTVHTVVAEINHVNSYTNDATAVDNANSGPVDITYQNHNHLNNISNLDDRMGMDSLKLSETRKSNSVPSPVDNIGYHLNGVQAKDSGGRDGPPSLLNPQCDTSGIMTSRVDGITASALENDGGFTKKESQLTPSSSGIGTASDQSLNRLEVREH